MDTIKANTKYAEHTYDLNTKEWYLSEIILEFENDRYGNEIIASDIFNKNLIEAINKISKEFHHSTLKNNSDFNIITNQNGLELFDDLMRQNFED